MVRRVFVIILVTRVDALCLMWYSSVGVFCSCVWFWSKGCG